MDTPGSEHKPLRIIGDHDPTGSSITVRPSLTIHEWLKSPEGQEAMARREKEAEEAAARQRKLIARHAELVATVQHPVLAELVRQHAPEEAGDQIVCLTCSIYQCAECTEPTWPCSPWSTIEAGA